MRRGGLVSLLSALLAGAGACGGSAQSLPTAPPATAVPTTPPQSNPLPLPGIWTGYLSAQRCSTGHTCSGAFDNVAFTLRIIEDGGGVSGFLEINKNDVLSWFPVALDIRGAIEPDGAVRFSSLHTPAESDNATIQIGEFVVRTSPTTGLSGTIDIGGWSSWVETDRWYRGSIASAAWRPLDAAPKVSGGWSGRAIIRSCSGVCARYLSPGEKLLVRVELGQDGAVVSGSTFFDGAGSQWLQVAGALAGDSLTLISDPQPLAPNAAQPVQLTQFSTTVDRRGMMRGRFTFNGDLATSFVGARPFRIECDIQWLTRDF